MEGILKLLRKLGYSEDEIKTVLNKVPVNQEGLTGTNVATGIFSKPKKGELAKDFLVSDTIGNPFEVNYFKGKSEKEILISAEAQLKMIDDELTKLTDQLLNKNLKLTEAQRINFARNLETRKRFKKDFETFKTKPEAEVLNIETGETVTDLKKLIDEQGTKNPPTTVAGQLETTGKRLEQKGKELEEVTKPKSVIGDIMRDYSDFNKYMQSSQKTGYVRATVRQIMREDIQAGKLKLPKELQDQVMQGTGEPIDVYRKVYGEGALEQIDNLADDLGQFRTEEEAAKFARSKYTIEPKAKPVDESISYEELEDIFKKDPNKPEGKANGGPMGLDYLTGQEPPKNGYAGGGRVNFQKGGFPKILEYLIEKLSTEKLIDKALLERASPKAVQDLYISKYGKLPSAEEIKDIVNKQLQNKGSMETVNPKTGEVTTPKEPIKTAENKSRQLTKEEIQNYEEAIGRNSEEWMSEGTVEEAEKALKSSKAEEAYYRKQYLTGKLDPVAGEKTEARMKFLQKKMEEAADVKDRRLITPNEIEELMELESRFIYKKGNAITEENFGSSPFAPSQETLDNLKKAREMTKGMSLHEEMNMVLNQYDKSMFIKNEQGMVDVTNPENVRKMALLLKRDHPELYRKLEGGAQIDELENFDITGRKPNATGGRIGFEEGSIPKEEDEELSEEFIKSRKAMRPKYSFNVQEPNSRTEKSGLPGKTNPKDYGLGITYLPDSGNETAPEIRVGGSRRGVGVEIRKKFAKGGLGYLVGE